MSARGDLEKEVLSLPPSEREGIALAAWQSLETDPPAELDPEGIALASARDAEIESGEVQPISHEEFLRRTGGAG